MEYDNTAAMHTALVDIRRSAETFIDPTSNDPANGPLTYILKRATEGLSTPSRNFDNLPDFEAAKKFIDDHCASIGRCSMKCPYYSEQGRPDLCFVRLLYAKAKPNRRTSK